MIKHLKDVNKNYCVSREQELHDMTVTLGRYTKSNVMLVGESGVGKSTLIWGLAEKIAKKLTIPSLVILGKKDLNIPIKKGREMAEKISNSKVVEIRNGGHFLQSEFPEQVNNEISHFFVAETTGR